jgi:predicted nucleic acid-binding protein
VNRSGFVVDASPLIALGRIHLLDLLPRLARPVIVPQGVLTEVGAKPGERWLADAVRSQSGLTTAPDQPTPPALDAWDLGRGESCVIAHALTQAGLVPMLDDRRARQAAQALGLPVIGTLGLLVRARRAGLIEALAPLIAQLRLLGFYAGDAVVREALARVGETPDGTS